MRIITWNCNGALRNKFDNLIDIKADLIVIQECENPKETNHSDYKKWSENHLWIGDTKNKGLGVFATNKIDIKHLNWSNNYKDHSVKHFLPCLINNDFDLLAVWTHKNNSPNFGYVGQFWKYLQINKSNFNKSIIVGDFNSNKIWDEWDRWWNHSDIVGELKKLGIDSLYHEYNDEEQGNETIPTFFLHRKLDRPYHIDYIFASQEFKNTLTKLEIGNKEKWLKLSDHLPIICDFKQ